MWKVVREKALGESETRNQTVGMGVGEAAQAEKGGECGFGEAWWPFSESREEVAKGAC